MPRTLTNDDLHAVEAIIASCLAELVLKIESRLTGALPHAVIPIIPFRLTPRQFACCVQRSEIHIQRQCRCRNIKAEGPPWLIHPSQLTAFHVDLALAVTRLKAAGHWPAQGGQE